MNPNISVIVPVYNAEKYIERCLNSIVQQTYKNLDIIVINDGSTDNTQNICNKFKSDNRITIVHKDNGGVSSARNTALDIAKGEYYTFVDADDYLEKDFISELYSTISAVNADIAECAYVVEDEDAHVISKVYSNVAVNSNRDEIISEFLKNRGLSDYLWHKMFKKELFEDLRFSPFVCSEDFELMCCMFSSVNSVAFTEKILYHYVRSSSSIGNSAFSKKKLDVINARKKVFDYYVSRNEMDYAHATATQILARIMDLYKEANESSKIERNQIKGILKSEYSYYYGYAIKDIDSVIKRVFRILKFTIFRIAPEVAIKIF